MTAHDYILEDFWLFCEEALGMPMSKQPHEEMCEFIGSQYSQNKLMLVPRGCWKTSIASTAYPLWRVLRAQYLEGNPAFRVLLDSATVRLSKYVLDLIASYCLNSEKLKAMFGDLLRKKPATAEGFSLIFREEALVGKKEPNFLASGVGAEKTGLHFDLIVMDDVVTKENVRTPLGREKAWEHYRLMQGIIESNKKEGQKSELLIVGTRYHDADVYGRIIKDDKKLMEEGEPAIFTKLIRAAIDTETGDLYYPEALSADVLKKKKQKMGTLFYAQYQNDPNQETAPFKREWLNWKSLIEFPELHRIRITVDPAFKEDESGRGDYTAIVVAGWDRWHQLWIIDVTLSDTMTPGKFLDEFFRLAIKYQVESAIIENEHQESMAYLLRMEMMKRGFTIPIAWEKRNRMIGKLSLWSSIQPYAERGGIRIAEEIPGATKVEIQDEWERAPVATHDDFMDALELHTRHLPMEVQEGDGRLPIGDTGGRSLADIALAREMIAAGGGLAHRTLADQFPHLRALLLERQKDDDNEGTEPSETELLSKELEASFRG